MSSLPISREFFGDTKRVGCFNPPEVSDPWRVESTVSWQRLGVIEACWLVHQVSMGVVVKEAEIKYHLDPALKYFRERAEAALEAELPSNYRLRYEREILSLSNCILLESVFELAGDAAKVCLQASLVDVDGLQIEVFSL